MLNFLLNMQQNCNSQTGAYQILFTHSYRKLLINFNSALLHIHVHQMLSVYNYFKDREQLK